MSSTSSHRFIAKCLIALFLAASPLLDASHIKVLHKVILNVTLDLDGPARGSYIDPPVYVYEAFEKSRIIIPSDVFFEVFSMTGKRIARIGRKGEGPGDFRFLLALEKHKGCYYFLDSPHKVNVYDANFLFQKRILLQGAGTAPYAFCLDFLDNLILVGQRWTNEPFQTEKCVSIYDLEGKLRGAVFDQRHGWEIYPENSLLHPVILTIGNEIFFAFNSIPIIWKLNKDGSIVNNIILGGTWWKKIAFEAKKFKKKRSRNAWKAINELALSGDLIQKLWNWRGNIVVQVVRDAYEDPRNLFFIIDKDLNEAGDLVDYPGYQFCGAGTFIYLGKLLEIDKNNREKIVEVLQCDCVF